MNAPSPSSSSSPAGSSAARTIAGIAAIALAIGIVAWLAWRAQDGAARAVEGDAQGGAGTPAAQPDDLGTDGPDLLLRSSKVFAIDDVTDAEVLMPSSKSGPPLLRRGVTNQDGSFFDDGSTPKILKQQPKD